MKTSELTGVALDWAVGTALQLPPPLWADGKCAPFSTDWAVGGPLIQRERICLIPPHADIEMWEAYHPDFPQAEHYGLKPLIAAMRCYVAAVMGDEVEVPDGL